MIFSFFGLFNAFTKHLRNRYFKSEPLVVGATPRSPKWPTVRKHHLERFPTCAACGCDKDLDVHHIIPFSIKPELELDPNNLISLCSSSNEFGLNCHHVMGHKSAAWTMFNENVRQDCKDMKELIDRITR